MKKRILSLLLVIVMMVLLFQNFSLTVSAAVSGDYEYTVSNGSATITKYKGSGENVIIPSNLDGYSVTAIGENAVQRCRKLRTITIPNSVTSIGAYAFYDCRNLTSITIPNSVTSIGDAAFYDCWSLTSITIPNSVTAIEADTFYHCRSLTSITIPNSLTSIDGEPFFWDSELVKIYCEKDSYAEVFAKNNNIPYVIINTTIKGDIKELQQERVFQAENRLKEAQQAKTFYTYNMAYASILVIEDTTTQMKLLSELAKLEPVVWNDDIRKYVAGLEELTKTGSGKIYDQLEAQINSTSLQQIDKEYLLGEITDWGRRLVFTPDYVKALDSLMLAWKTKTSRDIVTADKNIDLVENSYSKEYLKGELQNLKRLL